MSFASQRGLTNESQEPVHKLIPSLLTPKQLTRFSWPTREPTFSPRVTSQTCQEYVSLGSKQVCGGLVRTLHSKSSYPANRRRPETDVATDVIPHRMDSDWNFTVSVIVFPQLFRH